MASSSTTGAEVTAGDELEVGLREGRNCWRCTHQGCNKVFKRKDHLQRHAANHSQQTFHCHRCQRPFKRHDLLLRHDKRNVCDPSSTSSASLTSYQPSQPDIPAKKARVDALSSSSPTMFKAAQSGFPVPPTNLEGDFGFGLFPQASWDGLLTDNMAAPFNEQMLAMPWDVGPPQSSQVMASTDSLLGRLQRAYPELDVTLPFIYDSHAAYWSHTSPSFPFVHRGTFDVDLSPPELVIMISIIGSVHLPHQRNFTPLVQRIRGRLVQDFSLDMPVAILQAFALCHIHDTWYSTSQTQFVAQCMWPIVVAHSRKKGIGVAGRPECQEEREVAWAAWAKDEERRRAAYCVTLLDTQLSAFWNQHCSRQLSVFAHNLVLPCSRALWEASTVEEWLDRRDRSTSHILPAPPAHTLPPSSLASKPSRSSYLPGLHPEFSVTNVPDGYSSAILAALAARPELPLPFTVDYNNSLTVHMVLMGLIAAAWDCRTRGGMGIPIKDESQRWRGIVFNALISLRKKYEESVVDHPRSIEVKDLRDAMAVCIISVLCDIPMLNVVAGTKVFCGATIGPKQYSDAKRRVRLWAQADDAWTCVWQSTRYLRQALVADWGIYSSWAVYLTTLVIWAYFCAAKPEPPANPLHPHPHSHLRPHQETHSRPHLQVHAHRPAPRSLPTPDAQTRILAFLDRILHAKDRLPNSELEVEIRELLIFVSDRLCSTAGEAGRENGLLLKRLVGSVGVGVGVGVNGGMGFGQR